MNDQIKKINDNNKKERSSVLLDGITLYYVVWSNKLLDRFSKIPHYSLPSI
jgi:hypothetical protein